MKIIRTPVKGWSGTSAGVKFVDGVGKTDRAELIEWFEAKGYIVEDEKPEEPEKKPTKSAATATKTTAKKDE